MTTSLKNANLHICYAHLGKAFLLRQPSEGYRACWWRQIECADVDHVVQPEALEEVRNAS